MSIYWFPKTIDQLRVGLVRQEESNLLPTGSFWRISERVLEKNMNNFKLRFGLVEAESG